MTNLWQNHKASLLALGALAIALMSAVVVVPETQQAVVVRTGDPVRVITGPIIRIEHTPGDPFGEIAVQVPLASSNRLGRVEGVVRREQLEQIHLWMSQGTTVVLQGEIERRPGRSARLAGVAAPQALDDALAGFDAVAD